MIKNKWISTVCFLWILIPLGLFGQAASSSNAPMRDSLWVEQIIERKTKELISKKDTLAHESLVVARDYAQNADKLVSSFFGYLNMLLAFIGLLIAIGGTGVFFYLKKYAREKLAEETECQIAAITEQKVATIARSIQKEEIEERLRNESHLALVHLTGEKPEPSLNLVMAQFKKVHPIPLADWDELSVRVHKAHYDFVLLSDSKMTLDDQSINQQLGWFNSTRNQTALMYFGKKRLDFSKISDEQQVLLSSSNFPGQLYGNIMNLLKFRDRIKSNHS